MTHWLELVKLDVSKERLFEVAEKQYGVSKAQKMRNDYENIRDESAKNTYLTSNAQLFVQSAAPCQTMSNFAKMKKGF